MVRVGQLVSFILHNAVLRQKNQAHHVLSERLRILRVVLHRGRNADAASMKIDAMTSAQSEYARSWKAGT